MPQTTIEIEGLKELIAKFNQLPARVQKRMKQAMADSMNTLWENVPPYPPQVVPPEIYRRKGSAGLGGSLGSGIPGGKTGKQPDIYTIAGTGGNIKGIFGTTLSYAKYVIDPQKQAYMHKPGYKGRQGWWTMDTIKTKAEEKIKRLWNQALEDIKLFFNR